MLLSFTYSHCQLVQADELDKMESDENQADIEEGKDVESIKDEVKQADEVNEEAQIVKTQFLEEVQSSEACLQVALP